jgi:hypothetical protein
MKAAQSKVVTATGDITTADAYLRGVVLTAAADAATVTVKRGGSSGVNVLVLAAAIGTSASAHFTADVDCPDGIHVAVTGTTPSVSVIYA